MDEQFDPMPGDEAQAMPDDPHAREMADLSAFLRQRQYNEALKARLLEAHQLGARLHFRQALDIASVPRDMITAEGLDRRFQSRYVAPQLAGAIVKACLGDPAELDRLRQEVNQEGGLIEQKDEAEFSRRLAQPDRWIITEASGLHPDPQSPFRGEHVAQADCQCLLPADRSDARPVVPLLRPDVDTIYDVELAEKLRTASPASIGLIDQIAVSREFAHLRIAAQARYDAMNRIMFLQRKNRIDHMIGMAFCIQGVELESVEQLLLQHYDQKSLVNMISLLVNEHSTRSPAQVVGRLRQQKVPVTFVMPRNEREEHGSLLVDWYYLDHQIEHVRL